jgi:hypothetical protein
MQDNTDNPSATQAEYATGTARFNGQQPDDNPFAIPVFALSTIAALDPAAHPWTAELLRWQRARLRLGRADMGGRARRVPGRMLTEYGAPAELIASLPPADDIADAKTLALVAGWEAADRRQANEIADADAGARAAAALELPKRVDLLTYQPLDVAWLVDGLLPVGQLLSLMAERKAGKTTMLVELSRALLTGAPFLDRFDVHPPEGGRVVYLDTEMSTDAMHREFTAAGLAADALARIDYFDLRGCSGVLDMRQAPQRARWAPLIAPGSMIVLDCLYTVLAALNVDESSAAVASVIEGLKTLARERDAAGLVIADHLGKDPDRGARGHSSKEGGPYALAYIDLDGPLGPDTGRTFWAAGRRGVDVGRAPLTLTDGRLTLGDAPAPGARARARDRLDNDIVEQMVREHPGLSGSQLFAIAPERWPDARRISRDRVYSALPRLALGTGSGRIVNRGTDARPSWHVAPPDTDPLAPVDTPDDH